MIDFFDEPEFVEDMLDGITEVHLKFMDYLLDRLDVDAYFGGDDMCGQVGCLIGNESWRELFKPRLKMLTDNCHRHGKKYVLHSCGNVLDLAEDFIEAGVDVLESMQPEAMDVFELKRRTHGRMALIGGMGVQRMLFSGTPEEITQRTRRLKEELGKGGGYVIAPSKPISCEPAQNIAAFLEVLL